MQTHAEAKKLYDSARVEYSNLLASGHRMKQRQYWVKAIHRFQEVHQKYPDSLESYKAVFTLGRLYQHLGKRSGRAEDNRQALAYYYKLDRDFPAAWLTDDALYFAGELHMKAGQHANARTVFEKIVTRFPKEDFVSKAREQLSLPILKTAMKPVKVSPVSSSVPDRPDSPALVVLKDLTFVSGALETRIMLKMDGKVNYSKKRLSQPDRVYFDFDQARWADHLPSQIPVDDGRVQQIRITPQNEFPTRLVVDLDQEGKRDVGVKVQGEQLIIIVPNDINKYVAVKNGASTQPQAVQSAGREGDSAKAGDGKRVPLVVLDAGHGGKDNGAEGAGGLVEKDLNLEISRQVRKILQDRYHYKVIMTRNDDTFIELRDRGKVANSHQADIFVSIHANAAQRKSAHGIETYYLGSGSTEQARETAERENGELVHSVSDDAVQNILASLISTTKINDSSRLAARVQKQLNQTMSKQFKGVHDLGVKEGPFFVLHDTNMPSILVEVGFVTHSREGLRLKQKAYQKWLAESIARGIHDYLKEKAPSI